MKTIKIASVFLMCFQFSFANEIVKEDSLKSRFEINDPRNPNCPCHKYQKLADEEYRKLLAKEINAEPDKSKDELNNSLSGGGNLNSTNKKVSTKFRSIKWRSSFFDHKKKKSSKRRKIRRLRRDNASCFHF